MSDMDIVGIAEEEDDMLNDRSSVNTQTYSKPEHAVNGGGRLRNMTELPQRKMVDITRDKPIKVTIRVVVPVRDHPKFNFVGKLLGPKGNSLKRLQEDTMTKMAILGRGSMRDRHKEEELRNSGDPKFSHLSDELHVEVTAFAPPAEAHARIAYALAEVRRFLVPDYNDEIRQEQMWEMQILNTGKTEVQSDGSETVGDSTGSSQGSMSPQEQSTSPPPSAAQHPALRGVSKPTNNSGGVTSTGGRKRPLLPGGGTRVAMSPTKRTVLSILARARAAQAKELLSTPYQPLAHIASVRPLTAIPGLREDTILTGANLILN
ncbi:KH domain-containing, RNA-binding, signal transduction-associated protein 3-like isoform X2 [Homalodisca vitripennis]|uniref:KH domain-containing, RNA-binding, signal transduction-associated protein 3-like isoform X2 n=1 Tax=Homalodisca vitripennis TaxID=197043 RepID=UPI001EEAA616|nr:KH domain-containing, RNA-binding, signal transduction-associated protein 3-like isoform X2 [Homalodisca vitripennis]